MIQRAAGGARAVAGVGTEARRALRLWRELAAARAARVDALLADRRLLRLADDFAAKGALGAARSLLRLRAQLEPSAVYAGLRASPRAAHWTVFRPHAPVSGDVAGTWRQGGACVWRVTVQRAGRGRRSRIEQAMLLEVSDHALGRLLQRSPGVGIDAVLTDAYRSVTVRQLVVAQPRRLLIPAGDGAFLAEHHAACGDDGRVVTFFRASTWLSADQMEDDQGERVEALRALGRAVGSRPICNF